MSTDMAVVGAIRMALEGSEDDRTRIALIRALVEDAPATPHDDTSSVRLFVDAIQALGAEIRVPA